MRRTLLASAAGFIGSTAALAAAGCSSTKNQANTVGAANASPGVGAGPGAVSSTSGSRSASPQTGAASVQPKRGGIIYQRSTANPPALNLWTTTTNLDVFPGATCYNQLVQIDPADRLDAKILPVLAAKWEQPEDTVLTFTLEQGVSFHNGHPFTADDVVASLNWIRNSDTSARKDVVKSISKIETPSPTTIRVTLAQPDASLLANLATHYGVMAPADIIAAKNGLGKELIGTGPFKLVYYHENEDIKLERNLSYFRSGLPYLDGIQFYIIPDDANATEQFRGKRISYMVLPTAWNKSQVDGFVASTKDWSTFESTPSLIRFIIFVNAAKAPFNDLRVRQAIGYALNRGEFNDVVQGGFGVEGSYMLPGGTWALPDADRKAIPGMQENIAEAKKLLAAAGVSQLDVYLPARKDTAAEAAVFIQDKLKPLGLRANVDLKDPTAMYDIGSKGQFDLLPWPVIAAIDDPNAVFGELALTNSLRNWGKVTDPRIDQLYNAQSRELDQNKRKGAVNALEKVVLENLVQVPIAFRIDNNIKQTQVHDYTYHISWFTNRRLEKVWLG